jgi:hypothetical protein
MGIFDKKPRWTGKKKEVRLTGCLLPFINDNPFTLQVPGSTDHYVTVFSSPDRLNAFMRLKPIMEIVFDNYGYEAMMRGYCVKQISDGPEFLRSLRDGGAKAMLDPEIIGPDHTRWTEILFEGETIFRLDPERN